MAENAYIKKPAKEKKTNSAKKKSGGSMPKFNLNLEAFKDPRLKLVFGSFLMFLAASMLVAFFSYLFTGKEDQSLVEADWGMANLAEDGQEVRNLMGMLGAKLSYLFVYRWFGIASFLFVPMLALSGYQIVFKTQLSFFKSLVKASVFSIFFLSMSLGYLVLVIKRPIQLAYLCGGVGFELASFMDNLSGWGTAFFLILVLVVFIIYFFDIKTFVFKKEELLEEDQTAVVGDEFTEEAEAIKEEMLSNAEGDLAITEETIPEIIEPVPAVEEPAEPEVALDLGIPEPVEPVATPSEEELELTVEEPAMPEEEPEEELGLEVEEAVEEEETDEDTTEMYDPTLDLAHYKFPHLDLLQDYSGNKVQVTREELEANKNKIVETLGNYKIGIQSIKATIGPTVTLYEIVPEAGIKISKIKNLEDDIALGLAALGIRIIAPIPGRGTIGIEVPNKNRELVSIRSVFSTEKFMKSDMALPVVFGKNISNEVFMIDLAKMPHLLMAGATGQGKSVGINVILASLLYKKHPSQLKFVLVDPKKVELSIFSKIEKHFLAKLPDSEEPIITDTTKVVHTLNSLCIEMDARYDLLKTAGCRNIKEYNGKFVNRRLNPNNGHRYMPYIVVVIDELADLMMTAGKEVETPIARLAQLARAIGIHLVVATQRPSVNVITGIIKANFPARISFRVTSKIDSRTILDAGGADQLVGMGDMLFSQGSELMRVQCGFIDTPEVDELVDFIGDQQGYTTAYELPEYVDESTGGSDVDLSDRDSMFEEAARVIVLHQQGSTSLVQRKLKLGYNRAGRIIDQLEAAGIVGPFEGSKARQVLVPDELSLEQLLNTLG